VRQVLLCELVRYGNVAVQKVVWTYMRFKDGDAKVLSFLASRLALCNAGTVNVKYMIQRDSSACCSLYKIISRSAKIFLKRLNL
jgi:hypothetical protein